MPYSLTLEPDNGYVCMVEHHQVPSRLAEPNAHWHHHIELSCVLSGTGEYWVDEQIYDVQTGDVFIFNSEERHGLGVKPPDDLFNLVINMDPRFIWSLESSLFDARYLKIFYERKRGYGNRLERGSAAAEAVQKLFLEIHDEAKQQKPEYGLIIKTKLLTILAELLRHYGATLKSDENRGEHIQGLAVTNAVIQYIDEHLSEEIRLEHLANISHMNASYFSTFFKKFMGLTPIEFITRRRVQRAVEFLRTSERTILDIAHECGFNNSSSFNNAFRKMTGKTPSEFRRFNNITIINKEVNE